MANDDYIGTFVRFNPLNKNSYLKQKLWGIVFVFPDRYSGVLKILRCCYHAHFENFPGKNRRECFFIM